MRQSQENTIRLLEARGSFIDASIQIVIGTCVLARKYFNRGCNKIPRVVPRAGASAVNK